MEKLEVKNASFGYGDRLLFHDLSFSCEGGEGIAVVGPNGAGKSTLLRCVMGFLPWKSGQTVLRLADGTAVSQTAKGSGRKQFWRMAGYVPQKAENVYAMNVEEMILLGRTGTHSLFAQPGRADRLAVQNWMERLEITHLKGKLCSRISGGELQLVMLARALVCDPSVLFLDEPEAGLDYRNCLRIFALTERLKKEQKLAVLFNTHRPEYAAANADRVILLNGEGEYRYGPAAQMIEQEPLEWAYHTGIRVAHPEPGVTAVVPVADRYRSGFDCQSLPR